MPASLEKQITTLGAKEQVSPLRCLPFELAYNWTPLLKNPEEERIKELCLPVYDWVRTLE
jgi:hypothetical protein